MRQTQEDDERNRATMETPTSSKPIEDDLDEDFILAQIAQLDFQIIDAELSKTAPLPVTPELPTTDIPSIDSIRNAGNDVVELPEPENINPRDISLITSIMMKTMNSIKRLQRRKVRASDHRLEWTCVSSSSRLCPRSC